MLDRDNTIIALSTPYQISAIHILRLSGSRSLSFLKELTSFEEEVKPRHCYFRRLSDPRGGSLIDEVLCMYFPAPYSYTGEDMVEIHCHGSLSIVDALLDVAKSQSIILAKSGEFTQRAFLNGKMNIDQVQAVDTLIRSRHGYMRENSLKILTGQASYEFERIRGGFISMYAQVQSSIEFPDDDKDAQHEVGYGTYINTIKDINEYLSALTKNYKSAKKREEGLHVVILGQPNVGKSTLLNLLLGQDRSIVSSQAGTTRDYIKERYIIDGNVFWLYDTAGIREATDEIEHRGIAHSLELYRKADVLMVLLDDSDDKWLEQIDFYEGSTIIYVNKSDEMSEDVLSVKTKKYADVFLCRATSFLKEDAEVLRTTINGDLLKVMRENFTFEESQLSLLNDRQLYIVETIIGAMGELKEALIQKSEVILIVQRLQEINDLFDELSMKVDNEEVFDELFRSFCIGK